MAGTIRRGAIPILVAAVLLTLIVGGPGLAAKTTLVVDVPGGSFEVGWRKNIKEPFEKMYNCEIVVERGLTMETFAKLRAQKGRPQVDVASMDEVAGAQAAAEGLLELLDPEKIPNMKNILPFFQVSPAYYVKWTYVSQVITYNTDYVKTPPDSYAVFCDPKYKGRVAIPNISSSHGIYLLLMLARMNGGDVRNIDPGFEKAKELAPNIYTYWTSHDHLAKLFAQGDIWLATWSSDRAQSLADQGMPVAWAIPKEGAIALDVIMGIPKGAEKKDLAEKYIDFVLSREAQLGQARDVYAIPTTNVQVPADLMKKLPVSKEQTSRLMRADWAYINTVRTNWVDKWNREILTIK